MSRTDAHRPLPVVIDDHPELVREVHDHTDGTCELDGVPVGRRGRLAWERPVGGCHVWFASRVPPCSCPLCSLRGWRRAQKRTQRTNERAWARAAADRLPEDELDALEARLLYRDRGIAGR